MEEIILDTSVVVKFFSPGEHDHIIDKLLDQFSQKKLSLTTVDIAIYELINALKLSKKGDTETVYKNVLAIFEMKPKIISLSDDLIKKALDIMNNFPLTVYDAVFIAAAELNKTRLITADYKHHKKEISKYILFYEEWLK